MFLKNKSIIFKIRRSKVTDYAALRKEFNFCNVHGIMNISGLLQSKGFTLTLQETRSIHDSMNITKMNLLLILTFYHRYLKCEKIGIKTV